MVAEVNHDHGLVILSLIISVWGAYASLGVMGNIYSLQGEQRLRSLLASAVLLGVSIWTMHFIAMLSQKLPIFTAYAPIYVFLSLFFVILISVVAIYLTLSRWSHFSLLLGGITLGAAIAVMHVTGMRALRLDGQIEYEVSTLVLSVGIALVTSPFGLYLMRKHIERVQQGGNEKNRHIQASLVVGLGAAAVHYVAMGGSAVIVEKSVHVVESFNGALTRPELALIVVLAVAITIVLIPLLLRKIKFSTGTVGGNINYWLVGIGIFGISMTVIGQWLVANSFQKEASFAQVGYRIQSDLVQMRYMQEIENGEAYSLDDWLERIDDIAISINTAMMVEGVVSIKQDEQLRNELRDMLVLLEVLKNRFSQGASDKRASFVNSEETEQRLSAIRLLSEGLLSDSLALEQQNRMLLGFTNGANIIWFILVFSSVIVVMRRRQNRLESMNANMKSTLKELRRQKFSIDQHAIVAMTDPAGVITYVNDKFCQISQYAKDELLGANHRILNSGHHSGEFWADMWCTIGAGRVWQGEIRNRNKSGEEYWVNTTIVPFMDSNHLPERYLSIRTDITSSKQAEMELREKEYWMNSLIQALPDEVLLQDADTRWLIANTVLLNNLGLSGEAYQGLTTQQLVEKSDILKQRVLIDGEGEHIWQRDDLLHWELEYPTSEGNAIFDVVNVPLFNEDANCTGTVRVASNISVRKRVEEENQILASAIFQADEGMFITDAEGRLEYVNPAYEEMLSPEFDCLGTQLPLLNPDYAGESFSEMLWNALASGESWSGHYEKPAGDETSGCNLMVSLSPVVTIKGMRYVGLLRDVTDEQHLESQLQQAQKMEAIGRLAGGIAHDFNNILTAIVGYSDLVLDDLPLGSDTYRNMQEIQTASQRAKELVKQILSFSRRSHNDRQLFEAETVIKEAVRLIRASAPATIAIREDYAGISMMLEMDPTQLHQIIMNLCVNAMQAMDDKGQLMISTRQCSSSDADIPTIDGAPKVDYYLHLTLSDNGPGIPETLREKIFEPFFTTKEVGSGTGMGLAAVHGIVNNSQGAIRVHNRPEGGACFDVYLPLSQLNLQKTDTPLAPVVREAIEEHIGTVLYVDDEIPLTNVIQIFLTRQGFHVDVANDPLDALAMFSAAPEKYDVVVSDQVMPNMRGDQLVQAMLAIRPDIPFILCSGYSDAIDITQAKEKGVQEFLQKPLDFKQFSEILKNTIKN